MPIFSFLVSQTPKAPRSQLVNNMESYGTARKNRQVSKSQPGSRSASPSSRLSYYSNVDAARKAVGASPRVDQVTPSSVRTRKYSHTSREPSPNRAGYGTMTPRPSYDRRYSNSSSVAGSVKSGRSGGVRNYRTNSEIDLSHHNNRMLGQGAEELLENAFLMHGTPSRKKFFDDHSDNDSETSR